MCGLNSTTAQHVFIFKTIVIDKVLKEAISSNKYVHEAFEDFTMQISFKALFIRLQLRVSSHHAEFSFQSIIIKFLAFSMLMI